MARRVRAHAAQPASAVRASATRRRAAGSLALGSRIPSRSGLARDQVTEIQRSRLLVGAVGAIEEHGYAATTVAHITRRARISRRTFYELFANCEACLAELVGDVQAFVEEELRDANLEGLAWRERVRSGLLVLLSFCDREPALARVCVVEALRGGPLVLERREAILARLVGVIDEGRQEGSCFGDCTPLTAEGLVGAAFGIVHARLLRGDSEPLSGLLGQLMGMIMLPYMGPAEARREQRRPVPKTTGAGRLMPPPLAGAGRDPLQDLPMRVTYRTARVLQGIGEQAGVSNRGIADYAGIHDQGQISKLLARLERLGLVANDGDGGKGEPNAWSLTALGDQVTQRLRIDIGERASQ